MQHYLVNALLLFLLHLKWDVQAQHWNTARKPQDKGNARQIRSVTSKFNQPNYPSLALLAARIGRLIISSGDKIWTQAHKTYPCSASKPPWERPCLLSLVYLWQGGQLCRKKAAWKGRRMHPMAKRWDTEITLKCLAGALAQSKRWMNVSP